MTTDAPLIEGQSFVRRTLTTLIMLAAFGGLIALGWYANEESRISHDYTNLPLIKADRTAFKIKPTDPGGMKIPNTDIRLYDEIANDVGKRVDVIDLSAAKLSPPPEEPVKIQPVEQKPLPKIIEQQSTKVAIKLKEPQKAPPEVTQLVEKTSNEKPTKESKGEDSNISEITQSQDEISITPITPVSKPQQVKVIAAESKKINATKTHSYDPRYSRILLSSIPTKPSSDIKKPAASSPQKTKIRRVKKVTKAAKKPPISMSGSQLIQLGSYKSRASVGNGWKALQSRLPKELGKKNLVIKAVDLGPKGIYYRMLAGPFKNRDNAAKICKTLISKGQDCLVAR